MPYKKRQMDNMTKPKIIITIDTEVGEKAKFVKEGFEKFVMGKIGDENYGVPKIVDILNEHNIKGEFFVDVYEDTFFGKEKYASLCKYLDESGHGVHSIHTPTMRMISTASICMNTHLKNKSGLSVTEKVG